MLRRILTAAILAGVAAGLFTSALQAVRLVPLIHEAEVYESAAAAHDMPGHEMPGHDVSANAGDADSGWAPANGWERMLYTVLANVLAATGFALLLSACYALKGDADARQGVIWGVAGFAVFQLAPALGLPPELPGQPAAALSDRQIWWLGTAAATAGGLGLMVFVRGWTAKAAGFALMLLPHVIGAPAAPLSHTEMPAELAASFVAGSLAIGAAFWAALGGLSGYFFRRDIFSG